MKAAATQATSRLNVGAVEDVLARLSHQWEAQHRLDLDLREVDTVERTAGVVLANALAGTWGSAPLHVRVSHEQQVSWLTAAGFAFAFANRPGRTIVDGRQANAVDWDAWNFDWRLATGATASRDTDLSEELFAPEVVGETALRPDMYGPGFAAFVNPHLSTPRSGAHPVTTVLWPWLDRLLRQVRQDTYDRQAREAVLSDIGGFVDETVINISDHAAPGNADILSLVQLSVTRGGGKRSRNRLHLCVQDTGPGITTTARPKTEGRARSLSDDALLVALLDGTLAPWGRGRGQGLPRVHEICRRRSATLRIFTKGMRLVVDGSQAVPSIRASTADFSLDGTVVALTVPLDI